MSDLQVKVNDAFERISLAVLDASARAAALAHLDVEVATAVESIHEETVSQGPPRGGEEDAGRTRVEAMLRERYPWLSDRSVERLVTAFLYNWK